MTMIHLKSCTGMNLARLCPSTQKSASENSPGLGKHLLKLIKQAASVSRWHHSTTPLDIQMNVEKLEFLTDGSIPGSQGGGGEFSQGQSAEVSQVQSVMDAILALVPDQPRAVQGSFLMSVDHCFPVKGHGTVLTGTVLQVWNVRVHVQLGLSWASLFIVH